MPRPAVMRLLMMASGLSEGRTMQVSGHGKLQGHWFVQEDGSTELRVEDRADPAFKLRIELHPEEIAAMHDASIGQEVCDLAEIDRLKGR